MFGWRKQYAQDCGANKGFQGMSIGKFKIVTMTALVVAVVSSKAESARAYTFNTSPDWDVELDTNLSYGLGVRAQSRDPMISNNPTEQNNEYKFPNGGDITTNRLGAISELSIAYQNDYGLDISVDGWKDFAYGDKVESNPGLFAPGVPYSALSSSPDGRYGAYTDHFYNLGAELDNAFTFGNFSVGSVPMQVKVGRFVDFWGNAIFAGGQAISYGQSPIDIIKAVDAPGTQVKDLFLPRGQFSATAELSPELTLGFQYQFEYRYDRFPEGGTYLGVADPFFIGPTTLAGSVPRGADHEPPDVDGNFGVEALWSPAAINGTLGFYGRQFDDVAPYTVFQFGGAGATTNYHLSYARHIHLYGISYERNVGTASVGFETSVRQNTGLLAVAGVNAPNDPQGIDGPRGNILNVVANTQYALTPTPLWQTGIAIGEIAWTHVLQVTHDRALYDAKGYACSAGGYAAGQSETDGCATQDEVNAELLFDPQWLQVFPGIDLDAPMNIAVGLHGNGQTFYLDANGSEAGSVAYSAGLHALIRDKYNIKLFYSGYHAPTGQVDHNGLGQPYYASGSGQWMWNDKGQVELVLSTSF
jgi:hypothetical protein